jgi:hypothetical protein
MAKDPLAPFYLTQNPAPVPESGQDFIDKVREQTNIIMARFMAVLPSNYVSQTTGPFYTLQWQAAAEQLATFIVNAQEVYKDADYAFTRTDFLWEILGTLVFPGATDQTGIPRIEGDIEFRTFLQRMVVILLKGATKEAVTEGLELLTDSDITILERYIEAMQPGAEYTIEDQFIFDVFVEGFPADPFVFSDNVKKVLEALKPAHTLYDLRFLFRETFGPLFTDEMSWDMSAYYYDDLRKFCEGTRAIVGTTGVTLAGRTLFSDPARSFKNVQVNGLLHITAGVNEGHYRITDVLAFPVPSDATPRAYTTSPTGLAGTVTVMGDTLTDTAQNFALAVEGETITLASGPNAGTYRLDTLKGLGGGPVGFATGPATQVTASPSLLRTATRMPSLASGQAYSVDVDRLGVRGPRDVLGEDAAEQFYL